MKRINMASAILVLVLLSFPICALAACLYCDDFGDGVLDPNWSYIKPAWNESGGSLVGTPVRKAVAVATPVFAGCQSCFFEAAISTAGGVGNTVWMLAWYVDKKNAMELLLKEDKNKIILKQRSGGTVVAKKSAGVVINPNTAYDIKIRFDGSKFDVLIDSIGILSLIPAVPVPIGTIGFETKGTVISVDSVTVDTPTMPGPDLVITEIHANPAAVADSVGEWFEILNRGAQDASLDGCRIDSLNDAGHAIASGVVIGAGAYFVMGINSDPLANGGVTVGYQYQNVLLENISDSISITCGATLIDQVTYSNPTSGVSRQLDPAFLDPLSNDDAAHWCLSILPFGLGDLGTPGGLNQPCP